MNNSHLPDNSQRSIDDAWMARAILLAHRGIAQTHPNPMVGAILVKNDQSVGEGFHTYAGLKHAEIIALEKAGGDARGSTLYLNLEPCCHAGRTGPCTQAIIEAGIKRVVAAMQDPNPKVAGRGFRALRNAGIEVSVGIREEDARRLNEAFAKWIRTGTPFVTLKTALTLDGQIAATGVRGARSKRGGSTTWITSPESREEVQRLRHASDALLTGIGTVLADNPRMTDRTNLPRRRPLVRAIVDSRLRMPLASKIVTGAATFTDSVILLTTQPATSAKARQLSKRGVEIVRVRARNGRVDLREVLRELGRREIVSVVLEAGSALNGAMLDENLADKMILFYAPRVLGSVTIPVARHRARPIGKIPMLNNITLRRFGPDFAVEGYFHDVYRNH
ncbi:MAG TPA: bifunctional diaminohydroxyphosphoribosylaminopyrimidine deaminase/5-amino-6-(5-phosphoribosylamino)uracil reductase RibD [Candidatus Acidoferrales bacterium]|nr:bifunctional diaminohydroxyphosphoribosylaminopyrimidine deaminase/5-amino-6-(5-phosphoribosylamino)uracil reductase RibD [Candidatus Acidoferrales bacterium]